MEENDYYLFFHLCSGVGPKTFGVILAGFVTATKAYKANYQEWLDLGFNKNLVNKVFSFKKEFDFEKEKEKMGRYEVKFIGRENNKFPKLLREISDCPIGIFCRGEILDRDKNAVAVVGTRKVTNYGREVTSRLTKGLVANDLTIISGLARGVDGIAHRMALESGGRTIAVLGTAIDYIYPTEHRSLAAEIIKNGAIISEYGVGAKINQGNFPARNRIISGLSLGVLVTEGASNSGSKITANLALEQGREVFAVPGSIDNKMSEGPLELIQMGAKLVRNEHDILDELKIDKNIKKTKTEEIIKFENEKEEKVWQFLENGSKEVDEICRELKINIADLTGILTIMEIKGLIKDLGDGEYIKQ